MSIQTRSQKQTQRQVNEPEIVVNAKVDFQNEELGDFQNNELSDGEELNETEVMDSFGDNMAENPQITSDLAEREFDDDEDFYPPPNETELPTFETPDPTLDSNYHENENEKEEESSVDTSTMVTKQPVFEENTLPAKGKGKGKQRLVLPSNPVPENKTVIVNGGGGSTSEPKKNKVVIKNAEDFLDAASRMLESFVSLNEREGEEKLTPHDFMERFIERAEVIISGGKKEEEKRFCSYILEKGKNKGKRCTKTIKKGSPDHVDRCSFHTEEKIQERENKSKENSPEKRPKCAGNTQKGDPCKRVAAENSQFCSTHADGGSTSKSPSKTSATRAHNFEYGGNKYDVYYKIIENEAPEIVMIHDVKEQQKVEDEDENYTAIHNVAKQLVISEINKQE